MPRYPSTEPWSNSFSESTAKILITNENWRGKTDPLERRRIQNRLNQRAFRERRRETSSRESSIEADEELVEQRRSNRPGMLPKAASYPQYQSTNPSDLDGSAEDIDELGRTINRNVLAAVRMNVQRVRDGRQPPRSRDTPTAIQHIARPGVPHMMVSTDSQHAIADNILIHAIPHVQFRRNVLDAMERNDTITKRLSACIRLSGTPTTLAGQRTRRGFVVWGEPTDFRNWELSEAFVLEWGSLLEGCEDWLDSSNWWRSRRGEQPLQAAVKYAG